MLLTVKFQDVVVHLNASSLTVASTESKAAALKAAALRRAKAKGGRYKGQFKISPGVPG
jgi:hypothetical protein